MAPKVGVQQEGGRVGPPAARSAAQRGRSVSVVLGGDGGDVRRLELARQGSTCISQLLPRTREVALWATMWLRAIEKSSEVVEPVRLVLRASRRTLSIESDDSFTFVRP